MVFRQIKKSSVETVNAMETVNNMEYRNEEHKPITAVDIEEEDGPQAEGDHFGNVLMYFVDQNEVDIVRNLLHLPFRNFASSSFWKDPDDEMVMIYMLLLTFGCLPMLWDRR